MRKAALVALTLAIGCADPGPAVQNASVGNEATATNAVALVKYTCPSMT